MSSHEALASIGPFGPRASRPARPNSVESLDDGDLIQRIGERDAAAFDELYRRFARPILGLALKRLRDRDRAEVATQETFTSVWRAAKTYRPERGPGAPWLYAIARNAIVNQTKVRFETGLDGLDFPSWEASPAQQAESDWVSWRVHRALETLADHERTLIELAYWSELSQSEIAAELDMPLGTVKTRTRKALARLAALLEDEGLQ